MLKDVLFVIICFLSNIVQTITSFAGTVLAMPFALRLVGPEIARPILNLAAFATCLIVAVLNYKSIRLKELLTMLIFISLGFIIGAIVEPYIGDARWLMRIYGGIICIISVYYFFFNNDEHQLPHALLLVVLILGGFLHRLYISGGPLVVLYAANRLKEKNEFRATLSSVWVLLNGELFVEQTIKHAFNSKIWILCAIVAGVTILSIIIGKVIAKKISLPVFMKITYILLFISGLSILV